MSHIFFADKYTSIYFWDVCL